MRKYCLYKNRSLLVLAVALAACSATPSGDGTIIKTFHEIGDAAPYRNVLVISVAGEFADRVRFEERLVKAISGDENEITAYYTVVGRRAQLNRKVLADVVRDREFDAIILTRLKGQDRPDLVANRPTGHGFELYLYDYEELNLPVSIQTGSTVSFVIEFYDARARQKVWAIESLLFRTVSVASVLDDQVSAIAAEIFKERLVER